MTCCNQKWSGELTSHCSECCATFTSVKGFDQHRVGPPEARVCLDPATAASRKGALLYIDAGRMYPCWLLAKDLYRADPHPFGGPRKRSRLAPGSPETL